MPDPPLLSLIIPQRFAKNFDRRAAAACIDNSLESRQRAGVARHAAAIGFVATIINSESLRQYRENSR